MSKRPFRIRWRKVFKAGNLIFQVAWRTGVFLLLLGLVHFVYRGLNNNNFVVEAFHVPKEFSDAGLNGLVFANKVMDEVKAVEVFIASQKERGADVQSGLQPDLNFQVMGVGLTINSITYFLKEILGKERRTIGGELTDVDQKLELTLRISGYETRTFSDIYEEGKRKEVLDQLLHEAAKEVIGVVDPYRLSVYYYKKMDYEKAMELVLKIMEERPEEEAWAFLAWGNILNQQNRPKEACEKFKAATEVDPQFKLAFANWAWTEVRNQNYEAAIPLFIKANAGYPKEPSYYNGLAACYRNIGQKEKAETYYAKAASIDPENLLWWHGNWADMRFREMQDTFGALKLMEEAVEKLSESPEKYLCHSAYYFYKFNPDSANIMALKALEMAPNNIQALNQVANFHYYGGEYDKSIPLLKRKIAILEKDRNINNRKDQLLNSFNILAMAEYQIAVFDSALIHVNKAIEIDPLNAVPYTTLAETYGFMEEHEKFYEAFEKAAKLGFDFKPYLDTEPYKRYADETRFQQIIKLNSEKLEASLE